MSSQRDTHILCIKPDQNVVNIFNIKIYLYRRKSIHWLDHPVRLGVHHHPLREQRLHDEAEGDFWHHFGGNHGGLQKKILEKEKELYILPPGQMPIPFCCAFDSYKQINYMNSFTWVASNGKKLYNICSKCHKFFCPPQKGNFLIRLGYNLFLPSKSFQQTPARRSHQHLLTLIIRGT